MCEISEHGVDRRRRLAAALLGNDAPLHALLDPRRQRRRPHRDADAARQTEDVLAVVLGRGEPPRGIVAATHVDVVEAEDQVRTILVFRAFNPQCGRLHACERSRHFRTALESEGPQCFEIEHGRVTRSRLARQHRRRLRPVAHGVQPRHDRRPPRRDLDQAHADSGDLGLDFDHRLVHADARGVAREGELGVVRQRRAVFRHEMLFGGQKLQLVIVRTSRGQGLEPGAFEGGACRHPVPQSSLLVDLQRPEPRQALHEADGQALRTDPGLRRHHEPGHGRRRIRQCLDLRRPLGRGGGVGVQPRELRVALQDLTEQHPQLRILDGLEDAVGHRPIRRQRHLGRSLGNRNPSCSQQHP